ncbi:MAG TPA: MFS transporter [Thermomicrobiales bacterium]|nr:MFS transporter [Thermomicrobiales bacterium]
MTATAVAPRSRPPFRQTFRALHNRNYRLFWIGQLISQTGTWMQQIAQAWLILQLTNSPLALGALTTVRFAPILLFSLFGGVYADRFPKRRTLLCTQTVMLLQAAAMAVLTWTGLINIPELYVLSIISGLAVALDNPTRQAFVVELVGREDVPNAVALNSTLFNTTRIIGPAISGVLIATVGMAACFGLNAVSYLAVLLGLVLIRTDQLFVGRAPRERRNIFAEIGEGLRYASRTPDVVLVLILMAVIGTFGYNNSVLLPLIAQDVLHTGAAGFGSLTSAMGVGSLIAALGIAYFNRSTRAILLVGAAGFCLLLGAVGLSSQLLLTILFLVGLGVCSIVFTATANTRLQLVSRPEFRGRIMSMYMLLFAGTTPIGSLIVGSLAERFGVQLAVIQLAVICALGVVGAAVFARRRLHDAPDVPAVPTVAHATSGATATGAVAD